jgi:hypothetical protein
MNKSDIQWATGRLNEYIRKGFTMDDERLKNGGGRYFRLLTGKGKISHKKAVEKAEKEFEVCRAREMRRLESDFDRAVKELARKDAGGEGDEIV